MGHGRQQARRARLSLASGGHNCLARLPRVCQLAGGSPDARAPAPRRSARRPLTPVEGPHCRSRCSQPRGGCSRRSDHIGDSVGNTRACSPSRRTSISRWHACVHRLLLVDGWLASPRWPARRRSGGCCRFVPHRAHCENGRANMRIEGAARFDDRDHRRAAGARQCHRQTRAQTKKDAEGTRTPRRSSTSASEPKPWSTARPACSPTPDLIARVNPIGAWQMRLMRPSTTPPLGAWPDLLHLLPGLKCPDVSEGMGRTICGVSPVLSDTFPPSGRCSDRRPSAGISRTSFLGRASAGARRRCSTVGSPGWVLPSTTSRSRPRRCRRCTA